MRVKSVGEGLSALTNLESLEISIAGTNIGEKGGEYLVVNLRQTLLKNFCLNKLKINVHSNRLGDNTFTRIAKSIIES